MGGLARRGTARPDGSRQEQDHRRGDEARPEGTVRQGDPDLRAHPGGGRQGRAGAAQGRRAVPEEGRQRRRGRDLQQGRRRLRRAGLLPQGGRGLQADHQADARRRPGERAAGGAVPAARAHERRHGPAPDRRRRLRAGGRRGAAARRAPPHGGARPGEHRLEHQARRALRQGEQGRRRAGAVPARRGRAQVQQPNRRVPQGLRAHRLPRPERRRPDARARQHLPGEGGHETRAREAADVLQGRAEGHRDAEPPRPGLPRPRADLEDGLGLQGAGTGLRGEGARRGCPRDLPAHSRAGARRRGRRRGARSGRARAPAQAGRGASIPRAGAPAECRSAPPARAPRPARRRPRPGRRAGRDPAAPHRDRRLCEVRPAPQGDRPPRQGVCHRSGQPGRAREDAGHPRGGREQGGSGGGGAQGGPRLRRPRPCGSHRRSAGSPA